LFIGHFALGFLASRAEKRLPLGTALVASQLPDALWPYFLLTGVESVAIAPGDTAFTPLRFESYPWSHSLFMVAVAAALVGLAGLALGWPARAAGFLAGLAVSHWFLDFITHRPDMPLLPWGGPKVGLGMWNSVPLTVVVESSMFAGAVFFYAHQRRMSRSLWALIATLAAIYLGNVAGPPPPTITAVALSMVALIPLVWWWGNRVGVARVSAR
jgi:membrane-bound metal-dependent hydrolase YbcI (DUF457 family)